MPSRAKTLPSASSTDTADNDDEKNAPFAVFEEPDGSLTVSYSKSFQADDSRRDGIGECSQNLPEIVITGTATVTVLEGSVEILGCCLNDSDDVPSVDIYSPDGSWSSALTIVDTSYSRGKQIGTFFPTRLRISSLSFHNPVSSQWRRRTFALKTRSQVRCALSLPDRWKMAADAVQGRTPGVRSPWNGRRHRRHPHGTSTSHPFRLKIRMVMGPKRQRLTWMRLIAPSACRSHHARISQAAISRMPCHRLLATSTRSTSFTRGAHAPRLPFIAAFQHSK